ncbi:MAG: hypothetical protein L0G93_02305 [Acinetobacter sp.]|nr:hypothetical protein [Acinetobacter sp.]MDN5490436.1 hypothetical protein [Acinetobacter sp.]MDN5622655.1 hypothetical protein [Acinetobacter sp.]MDN5647136.1 hypothetical protein [Acinetobacter sp.]MDN5690233.1 hypothetical protein [Acinetobacter sp.]
MNDIEFLYQSLNERRRPEDIAEIIRKIVGSNFNSHERQILEKAAQFALVRRSIAYTSMSEDFRSVVGAQKQVNTANTLFHFQATAELDYCKTENIQSLLQHIESVLFKKIQHNDFAKDRLNKNERDNLQLQLSKRQYNKRWRLAKRIEKKQQTIQKEQQKLEYEKIAKHGFAHNIGHESFTQDINTACFIAYYTARCNLRSVFTNASQEQPFDEICEMLLNRCKKSQTTNWWAIAQLYITPEVLKKLSEIQKGNLLGKWTSVLENIADFLQELWRSNNIDRQTMIVKKGNDSSTWNHAAGAWNKARDQWMQLIYVIGLEAILDDICFGKVLRLMAADVAAWHFKSGGQLDPNTLVWSQLPLPWEVLQGQVVCTKSKVINQCLAVNLDPEKSGWIAPKLHGIVQFKPTPELVHGVAVSNPFLASILKRNKFFSGK